MLYFQLQPPETFLYRADKQASCISILTKTFLKYTRFKCFFIVKWKLQKV